MHSPQQNQFRQAEPNGSMTPSPKPLPEAVEATLQQIGLEPRELRADPARIPREFIAALPASSREFIAGHVPPTGFGITGKTGVGKTCAMVGLLRMHLLNAIKRRRESGARGSEGGAKKVFAWVDWPLSAHWLRSNAVSWPDRVALAIDQWCKVPVLILDDLGSERRKGDYQEDYACGELDYVISARYRACLPTWYTTNLDHAALVQFYGARMISRLTGESPLVELHGVDQRIVRR